MTVISVAVIALAALMLVYPEWRTGATKLTLLFLWLIVGVSWVCRLYGAGTLNLTPGQLFSAKEKPEIAFLEYLAIMVGAATTVFLSR